MRCLVITFLLLLETSLYDKIMTSKMMKCVLGEYSNMIVEKIPEDERRNEVWNELKANLNEIKKPKNVHLLGEYGTGKSSFINTVIIALTGRYRYYADIGSGNLHCTTRLHK